MNQADLIAAIASSPAGLGIMEIIDLFCRTGPLEPGPTPLSVCHMVRDLEAAGSLRSETTAEGLRFFTTGKAATADGGDIFGGL